MRWHENTGTADTREKSLFLPSTCESACFTLIEFLIVIAIIAILASMLLPALNKARESVNRIDCMNRQRQIGLALMDYAGDYKTLPIGSWNNGSNNIYWQSSILKILDSKSSIAASSKAFRCPGDKRKDKYFLSFAINGHLLPGFSFGSGTFSRESANILKLKKSSRTALLVDGTDGDTAANVFTAYSSGLACMTVGSSTYRLAMFHNLGANLIYADLHGEYHKLPTAIGSVVPPEIIHIVKPSGSQWIYAE